MSVHKTGSHPYNLRSLGVSPSCVMPSVISYSVGPPTVFVVSRRLSGQIILSYPVYLQNMTATKGGS